MSPVVKPFGNHSMRCCELPCVNVSGVDGATGHALQAVIAHRGGGIQTFAGFSGTSSKFSLIGRVSPDTREAIGL